MKIMRPNSCHQGCGSGAAGVNMRRGTELVPAGADRPCVTPLGEPPMTWQTPTAVDFRFGFEITMYVAAR
jgi:coenzyme PQQ precursor peptide PqqA